MSLFSFLFAQKFLKNSAHSVQMQCTVQPTNHAHDVYFVHGRVTHARLTQARAHTPGMLKFLLSTASFLSVVTELNTENSVECLSGKAMTLDHT